MKKRINRRSRARALILESLDPRLCLAAGIGSAGITEMHVENASAHVSHWHNTARPHDVNQDRSVTPADALVVINTLNTRGARTLSAAEGESTAMIDVDGDSQVTPADCLSVVNALNQRSVGAATVEETPSDDTSVDETPVEDGNVDEGAVDEGTTDDGTTDDGTTDDGTTDDGTIDDGTVDDGTVDDGTVDDGTTENDVPTGDHGCGDSSRPSIADRFARADANEDGVLTEDEVPQQLWERLSGADTDASGDITLEELTAFKPEGGPHGRPHDGHGDGAALDRFDENNDGVLTSDELPEEVWEHLSAADTDGDGAISAEELAAFHPAPPTREDLFARLDTDGDGFLTEDELPPELWERLSAADTDGDGSITLDELTAFKPEGGRHGPRPGGHGEGDIFDRLDEDDDGLLAEDEVPDGIWERISPADADGDGFISSEELAAFRPAPPEREGLAPTDLAGVSLNVVLPERGLAPHHGGGLRAMMPRGGNVRRG